MDSCPFPPVLVLMGISCRCWFSMDWCVIFRFLSFDCLWWLMLFVWFGVANDDITCELLSYCPDMLSWLDPTIRDVGVLLWCCICFIWVDMVDVFCIIMLDEPERRLASLALPTMAELLSFSLLAAII